MSSAAPGWLVGIVGAVDSEPAVEPGNTEPVAEKEHAAGDAGIAAVVALVGNGEQPVADIVVAGDAGIEEQGADIEVPAVGIEVPAVGIGAGLEDIVAVAELGGNRAAALEPASCDAAPE